MNHRRDILKLAGLAAAGLPLLSSEPHLPSKLVDANDAQLTRKPFGDERIYFNGATAQLKSVTTGSLLLHPGQEPHPPHQHPEEEFMIVTEGHGEILVHGVTHKVGPGAIMYCEGNQLHGVKNTGTAPFVFYFSKWMA
jgi:mannose-6-phosphate isomerase-like protein (cupin superfamily)